MRWLLTYADLVTLLLILFIMLYSMSMIDAQKFKQLAQYLRAAFGGVLQQGPTFLKGQGDRIIPDLVQRLSAAVESAGGEGAAQVFKDQRGIVVRLMTDNVLFEKGSADVNDATKNILDALAKPLAAERFPILVEGHTDDLPIRGTGMYASNWELSTARASAVVRHLITADKLPASRLSAAGYAEFHPVARNTDEASRRRNRRIDIVVLQGAGSEGAPESAPAPVAPAQ